MQKNSRKTSLFFTVLRKSSVQPLQLQSRVQGRKSHYSTHASYMEYTACSTLFSLLCLHSYIYILIDMHSYRFFTGIMDCSIYQETFEGDYVCGSVLLQLYKVSISQSAISIVQAGMACLKLLGENYCWWLSNHKILSIENFPLHANCYIVQDKKIHIET